VVESDGMSDFDFFLANYGLYAVFIFSFLLLAALFRWMFYAYRGLRTWFKIKAFDIG